jgi:restriction endonuclease Mrr
MAIPKPDALLLPLLRFAANGEFCNTDATERLATDFQLTREERAQALRNGRNKFANLVHWAAGQLGMAELLKGQDGVYKITEHGREVLANPPATFDRKFLAQFPEYQERIARKTVVRTEGGELEVEIPEREEEPGQAFAEADQIKRSIKMQANVAQLGVILGFSVWVPPADRTRVSNLLPNDSKEKLRTKLPLNFDTATVRTIENIDVI